MRRAITMPPEGRTAGLWEQPAPFQLPHSVEMAFVRSMECPWCHSNLLLNAPAPKSPEKVYCPYCGWTPRDVKKEAAGYGDDFRTLVGMMKHAYEQEDYSQIYQISQRIQVLTDELIPQAHEEQVFGNDTVPGHDQLVTWMYGQGNHLEGNDLIDKHVALQSNQFGLPGRIKQQAEFIDKDITDHNLTGFKMSMMQEYVQAALAQFHDTGKWQGLYKVMEQQGGEWAEAMKDPEKSMGVIDGLFEYQMSKSDPIYQKLQRAVYAAEDVGNHISWIENYLDEADQKFQQYHELRTPAQEQYDLHQQQMQQWRDQNAQELADIAKDLGIDLNSKTSSFWYHVAPTTERARIQTHGLIPAHPGIHPQWSDQATDVAWQPEGVYVSPNEDMAKYYQQHYYTGQPTDIWRIPVDQVQEYYPDPLGEYYIKHPVQPELHLPYEESLDKWGKTAAHVDVNVQAVDATKDYWGGSVGIEAKTPEGQPVGILIVNPAEDRVSVEHAEVDPKYRDTDVFMQLAVGLVQWMRSSGNVKPIDMQTIYPGIKALVDRWNSRFDQLPENLRSDLYDINQIAPGQEDFAWFYSREADYDMPPLENPVSYNWIPWTQQELNQWDTQDRNTHLQWKRRARNLTRGARRRGYAGTVTGRDMWLLDNRYRGNCAYCGQPGADSYDHVVPLSQGGEHTPSNLLPCHLQCNHELGQWDDRNREYVSPTTEQMKPYWTMQPAEANWKPQRISKLRGFRVWSADLHQMAEQKRDEAKAQLRAWRSETEGPQWQTGLALIQQIPDQGYKLIPWATREIVKNNLLDIQGFAHAQDIINQAAQWFDWCREHNKPLPEFNRKDFGFHALQDWVYEMNANKNVSDEWTDSTPVYTWEDGWHMDRVGENDLAKEGELMGHCVGGYCNEVRRGDSIIFSLRDPKGMPHVTLEIQGRDDFSGTEKAQPSHGVSPLLTVVQVQGKQDTEPIPEYREYIDDWIQTLRLKGWDVEEEDPDREPEFDYREHNEGPQNFEEPEDYRRYHEIMMDRYDRDYHFGEDEDPEEEGHNVWVYQNPRNLNLPDSKTMAEHAVQFIKQWEAGQYTDEDAVKMVQAMWLALKHSTTESQLYNNDWNHTGDSWEERENNLQQQENNYWNDVQEMIYWDTARQAPKPKAPTLFNPSEYDEEQHSKQVEAFLNLMQKMSGAPEKWQVPFTKQVKDDDGNYVYRNTETGETGKINQIGYPSTAVTEPVYNEDGTMQMLNRNLVFPGSGGYPQTEFPEYFRENGLDQFPAPVTSSWIPLEGHQSASNGKQAQPWTLTSGWKKIPPSEELRNIAQSYVGKDYNPPQTFPDVDPSRARRIAEEYEKMEHNPHDPKVREAYEALMRETQAQYEHLVNHGYQMEFEPEGGAYASPWDAINDIRDNKHLYVYPTSSGFGSTDQTDHPLLSHTGYDWNGQPVTYNDLFRGVHDVFGHAKEGVGFRSDGEENAWRQHSAMYSEPARRALTSETRGQNSWVNYGPYGEQNQNGDQANTVYADQKAGIMPDWTVYEGAHDE